MKALLDWLGRLPSGAQSGAFTLAAAALALLGVLASLWHHRWREMKNQQSEMLREAYFEMASAAIRIVSVVSQAGDSDAKDTGYLNAVKDFQAAFCKLRLVADLAGIQIMFDFNSLLISSVGEVHKRRFEMLGVKRSYTVINDRALALEELLKKIPPGDGMRAQAEPILKELQGLVPIDSESFLKLQRAIFGLFPMLELYHGRLRSTPFA